MQVSNLNTVQLGPLDLRFNIKVLVETAVLKPHLWGGREAISMLFM